MGVSLLARTDTRADASNASTVSQCTLSHTIGGAYARISASSRPFTCSGGSRRPSRLFAVMMLSSSSMFASSMASVLMSALTSSVLSVAAVSLSQVCDMSAPLRGRGQLADNAVEGVLAGGAHHVGKFGFCGARIRQGGDGRVVGAEVVDQVLDRSESLA